MKQIISNGQQFSEPERYNTDIVCGIKAGTQDVVIEWCDVKDDPADNANWHLTGVILNRSDETHAKPVITCLGAYFRARVDHASTHDCVVVVDVANTSTKGVSQSLG